MSNNDPNASEPPPDAKALQKQLQLKEFTFQDVQPMIDNYAQWSLDKLTIGEECRKTWFEDYLSDNNFCLQHRGVDVAHGVLEAIDHWKCKDSYLVARLNNSIEKKQDKIDQDLLPFLEGETKQAQSIKAARLDEAKKWLNVETSRVGEEIKQCYDIEFGFRKTSEQRELVKREKNEAIRIIHEKYQERVKWIEEACVDRIVSAQSNLNRIRQEKQAAKERAQKTGMNILKAQSLRDWVYETYVRPVQRKRPLPPAQACPSPVLKKSPAKLAPLPAQRNSAAVMAPPPTTSRAHNTRAKGTLRPAPLSLPALSYPPVTFGAAKAGGLGFSESYGQTVTSPMSTYNNSSMYSYQQHPAVLSAPAPAPSSSLLKCNVAGCDHEGFLSRSGLNRHRRRKHGIINTEGESDDAALSFIFGTEEQQDILPPPAELKVPEFAANERYVQAADDQSATPVNDVSRSKTAKDQGPCNDVYPPQQPQKEQSLRPAFPESAEQRQQSGGDLTEEEQRSPPSQLVHKSSDDEWALQNVGCSALEGEPATDAADQQIPPRIPEVDTHEAAEALLRLSGRT